MRTDLVVLLLSTSACTGRAPFLLDPTEGSSAGYHPVTVDLEGSEVTASQVVEIRVGGVLAPVVEVHGDTLLEVLVQGSPDPGPADVRLATADQVLVAEEAFTYLEPIDPVFDRVVAVGASVSMGVQSAAITTQMGMESPPALVAQATGAYLGLPLVVPDLLAPLTVADVGPAPDCVLPNHLDHLTPQIPDVIERMTGPDGFSFRTGRLDPDLEVRNLAVAGSNISDIVHGPPASDFGNLFFDHIVHDVDAAITDPAARSQIDLAEELEPTLVLAMDLFGNDLIDALTASDIIDPTLARPLEVVHGNMELAVDRLAATGAEVFVANTPLPTALPLTDDRWRHMVAEGATEAEADAAVAAVEALTAEYNAALDDLAAAHDNVHVVDTVGLVESIQDHGLEVGGEVLSIRRFDGLISLDGLHFTRTGYAVLADLFIASIEDELGLDLPVVDVEAAFTDDPYGPDALREAGLDIDACLAGS